MVPLVRGWWTAKAACTPGQHIACNTLRATCCLLPSTCCHKQHVDGNKIVASLLPVCWWIQRDTSRPWHKWIVIILPRYRQHVAGQCGLRSQSTILFSRRPGRKTGFSIRSSTSSWGLRLFGWLISILKLLLCEQVDSFVWVFDQTG